MDFEVTDTITLKLKNDKRLADAIQANKSYVTSEVLAKNIEFVESNLDGEPLSFDDIKTVIHLEKAK